jgi:formamidopyrimidine-DNA glycosylase
MPELPEVEVGRLIARRVAAGRVIIRVRCADDPIVFDGVTPARFRRALLGRRVQTVRRHGKHLWFELDRRPWPILHFGMTGGFHTPGAGGVKLVSSGDRDPDGRWPPRFTRLHLVFDDGGELVFADARRLGRVRLRHDPRREPPISLLGFDALHEIPSLAQFHGLVSARATPLKALLLDQSFAAGVGNWIADEVLYQAGLDPRRPARSLSREEVARLRARLRAVVARSAQVRSDSDRYPRSWLFHYRWGKRVGAVTGRGESIRYIVVAGRTTAWVPSVQR